MTTKTKTKRRKKLEQNYTVRFYAGQQDALNAKAQRLGCKSWRKVLDKWFLGEVDVVLHTNAKPDTITIKPPVTPDPL